MVYLIIRLLFTVNYRTSPTSGDIAVTTSTKELFTIKIQSLIHDRNVQPISGGARNPKQKITRFLQSALSQSSIEYEFPLRVTHNIINAVNFINKHSKTSTSVISLMKSLLTESLRSQTSNTFSPLSRILRCEVGRRQRAVRISSGPFGDFRVECLARKPSQSLRSTEYEFCRQVLISIYVASPSYQIHTQNIIILQRSLYQRYTIHLPKIRFRPKQEFNGKYSQMQARECVSEVTELVVKSQIS